MLPFKFALPHPSKQHCNWFITTEILDRFRPSPQTLLNASTNINQKNERTRNTARLEEIAKQKNFNSIIFVVFFRCGGHGIFNLLLTSIHFCNLQWTFSSVRNDKVWSRLDHGWDFSTRSDSFENFRRLQLTELISRARMSIYLCIFSFHQIHPINMSSAFSKDIWNFLQPTFNKEHFCNLQQYTSIMSSLPPPTFLFHSHNSLTDFLHCWRAKEKQKQKIASVTMWVWRCQNLKKAISENVNVHAPPAHQVEMQCVTRGNDWFLSAFISNKRVSFSLAISDDIHRN